MAGKPAATVGSNHTCPMCSGTTPHVGGPITQGSPNVFINGKPAARMGDMCTCVGPPDVIAQGNPTVLINGVPIATVGSMTAHGGIIISGESNVIIGSNTPKPLTVTMPITDIPFPKINIIDKVLSSKYIKEATANQEKLKAEAYNDNDDISISSRVAIKQLIDYCKDNESKVFINQFKLVYGNKIDEESFKILQEKGRNNKIKQPLIKTTKGYVQNEVYYSFKEGKHIIQVTERIIKASKESEAQHDKLMLNLANAFHDYIEYIIKHECQPTQNT
ncbi:PAAR repeat-containing protein [Cellulophaga algicola DSM 14237]|uniref:PAAR repeat-containing protein n=1 Tax=Cellulophaga algicola (strain DSM 14237 / IC166 / ACAM 630) TaxID=688270 RepID=E6X5K1_CELAD|nr:PAAR domain-containing protein [Cellulophaga algicola]ADV50556.1 PAAR repeat-containing protein [Cellulophaga algicola DSM 14237]